VINEEGEGSFIDEEESGRGHHGTHHALNTQTENTEDIQRAEETSSDHGHVHPSALAVTRVASVYVPL